jgi:hypothetical protein
MTSAAANDPPRTPPSAEVAILEGNAGRTADAGCSFMEFIPVLGGYNAYASLVGKLEVDE